MYCIVCESSIYIQLDHSYSEIDTADIALVDFMFISEKIEAFSGVYDIPFCLL